MIITCLDYEERLRLPPDILVNAFSFAKLEKWYQSVSFSLENGDLEHLYRISTHPVISPLVKTLNVCTEKPLPITMKQLLEFERNKAYVTYPEPALRDFDAIHRSLTEMANAHRIFEESAEDVDILSRCMNKFTNVEIIQIDNFYRHGRFNWEAWRRSKEWNPLNGKSMTHLLSVIVRSLATSDARILMVMVRCGCNKYWWGFGAVPLSLTGLMSLDKVRGGQLSLTTFENALSRLRKLELTGIYYYENEEDESEGSDLHVLHGSNQALRCILSAAKSLEELIIEFTNQQDRHGSPIVPLPFST
ncbi:MAG: hypothetical protein LQ342_008170 [Letrouitia transgressa]|nr:MAG: hypothetical protein LQ342_008170 [Letrouitia transgressa]